jgi:flagellar basal-body rod modification protein FlgD
MSTVNNVGAVFSSQTATEASSQKSDTSTSVDTNEFLKLLVAQLKNQDPMNPVDNQQFIAQLATFSSLEQLISINEGVSKLAAEPADMSRYGRG